MRDDVKVVLWLLLIFCIIVVGGVILMWAGA